MSEHSDITQRASDFVFTLFKDRLPEHLVYHNFAHTEGVADVARKLAKGMKLGEEGIEIATLAGWLHDAGYVEIYKGHEDVSKRIAEEFLRANDYPTDKIDLILGCIEATRMPQSPKNLLEEIVADADLASLGKKSYVERSELLRIEWGRALGKTYTDEEWLKQDYEFLLQHKYFTRYAQEIFEEQKSENIRSLDKIVRKLSDKSLSSKDEAAQAKLEIEREKLARQTGKEQRPDRGIETMFRLLSRNHIDLSSQAERKAQTMITANSIIISFIVGFVIRKLDENPELAVPGFFLLAVCVLAIIFAVLATRPKVSRGRFTRDDITNKRANLLFFGNFYKMKYDDFEWGMKEMMQDKEFLYGSLIKDNYYLGKVIGKKYEYLRLSYNIFMYGLIIAVVLFLFAVLLPEEFGNVSSLAL
jgi:HD superfamily phosphodiesterase